MEPRKRVCANDHFGKHRTDVAKVVGRVIGGENTSTGDVSAMMLPTLIGRREKGVQHAGGREQSVAPRAAARRRALVELLKPGVDALVDVVKLLCEPHVASQRSLTTSTR